MKLTPRPLIFLFAVLCGCFLNSGVLRADDGQSGGGDVDGNETFNVELAMTRAAAPATASVRLRIEAENDHGQTVTDLKLETKNLIAGTYNVFVTLKSDSSTLNLGSFTLPSSGEFEVKFSNKTEDDPEDEAGETQLPLPANFNALDIATVFITDASNVTLFTADLTKVSSGQNITRNATVTAQPGPGAPTATGTGVLTASVSGGKPKGSVQLNGTGLPAKIKIGVFINGVLSNAKKAGTDNAGNIAVRVQPKGKTNTVANGVTLFQVTSIELRNQVGSVLLSASF